MPDPITPNTLMTSLRDQLRTLTGIISECSPAATVYQIGPYRTDGKVPDVIEVSRVTGDLAIDEANAAYRDLSKHHKQPPGHVLRLPGVMMVDRSLDDAVTRINTLKHDLQELLKQEYKTSRERNTFCKREFPGRVMLQVYRKIFTTDRPVIRATFTWEPFTRSTSPIDKDKAIDLLTTRQELWANQQLRDPNDVKAVDIALQNLYDSSSAARFAIMKPRAPYPIMNLYFNEQDKSDRITAPANLPIIIPRSETIHIDHLDNLNTLKNKRRARSNKIRRVSIYTPLNLYQLFEKL